MHSGRVIGLQVQILICECVNYFVSRDSNVYDRVNG